MSNDTSFEGQSDDVEAIYAYMKNAVPKTTEATTVRSQFLSWYGNATFWDKSMSSSWYDEARSRRNLFNLKNATTPVQKAQVENVLSKGMTTEQMEGKPRPVINIKTGAVGSQVKNPTVPGIAPGLTRNLKLGLKGDDVKQWQSFLGLTPPTGYFDAATDKKTRDYQRANGLLVDGVVGKNTWGKAFAEKANPFSEPLPVAANIASAFKPAARGTPRQTAPAAASPSPRAATTPAAAAAKVEASAIVSKPTVMQKIAAAPLWQKALGGAAAAGAVFLGVKKLEPRRS